MKKLCDIVNELKKISFLRAQAICCTPYLQEEFSEGDACQDLARQGLLFPDQILPSHPTPISHHILFFFPCSSLPLSFGR